MHRYFVTLPLLDHRFVPDAAAGVEQLRPHDRGVYRLPEADTASAG